MLDGNRQIQVLGNFAGGVNLRVDPELLAPNEAVTLDNFYIDPVGKLTKRSGYVKFNTTPITGTPIIQNLYRFYKEDRVTRYFLAAAGTAIYRADEGAGTWTAAHSGLSATDEETHFATLYDRCFIANGVDVMLHTLDATTFSQAFTGTAPPILRYIIAFRDRVWGAGNAVWPNYLFYSEAGDPQDWMAPGGLTGTVLDNSVVTASGEAITGVAELRGYVLVFTANSVQRLIASGARTNWYFSMISGRSGAMSQKSIQEVSTPAAGNILMFIGKDNVYGTDGNTVFPMADKLDNDSPTSSLIKRINKTIAAGNPAICYDNKYRLSVGIDGSATENHELVYDAMRDAWSTTSGIGARCYCAFLGEGENRRLFFGSSSADGLVYELEQGTNDDGTAIEATYLSPKFSQNRSHLYKRYGRLGATTDADNGTMTLTPIIDDVGQTALPFTLGGNVTYRWNNTTWNGGLWEAPVPEARSSDLPITAHGKWIQLQAYNTGANQPLKLTELRIQHGIDELYD